MWERAEIALLQQFGRKQGHGPKPFSSGQAATELTSSTKVTAQNPSKATTDMTKTLPKSRHGWVGGEEEAVSHVNSHHFLAQVLGFPIRQGQVSPSACSAPPGQLLRGTPVSC